MPSDEEALQDSARSEVLKRVRVEIYFMDGERAEEIQTVSSSLNLEKVRTISIGYGQSQKMDSSAISGPESH